MQKHTSEDLLLTAQECADRIGISIRALRLYEQRGLITPRRTAKQWRLYGGRELARLSEILALKYLGLSLRDIERLLKGHATDLSAILALQAETVREMRDRASRGLQVINALQASIGAGTQPSIQDLTDLAREMTMNTASTDTAAWRRYEQMRPRTEVAIEPALCDLYAGAYETPDGTLSIVTHRDGRMFHRIVGQSDIEIFPENDKTFFMKVLPVQVTFRRAETGAVLGTIHHQDGQDDPATRVDLSLALDVEAAMQARLSAKRPLDGGEIILRTTIESIQRGEPDFDLLSPFLGAAVREQDETIRQDIDQAGPLLSLSFKGIDGDWDVYEVDFENARMEWRFVMTHRGKMRGLFFRPTL